MLANNIIRQIFTQFFGLFGGLVTSVITARILGPEGRGEFSLFINTLSLLSFVFGFSFGTSIIHVLSSNKMNDRRTINSFLVLIYILLFISMIFFYIFPKEHYHFFIPVNSNTNYFLIILFFLFSLSLFNSLYASVLSGKKMFKEQQYVFVLSSVVSIILYVFLYFFKEKYNLNLLTFLLFYSITVSIPVIALFVIYVFKVKPKLVFEFLNIKQLKYLFGFSFMAYIGSILHFLSCRMDFWFVEYYDGSKNLGFYSLASNLSQMLWIVPQAISSILISYAAGDNIEKSIDNTNTLSRITITVIGVTAVILFFTIGFIIPLLFGNEYYESIDLFKLLLFGIVPFSITTILSSFFIGIGKMKINLMASFISFLLGLILDLFFIPLFGVKGAAYASILAYIVSTIFIVSVYMNLSKAKLKDLIVITKPDYKLILNRFGLNK